MISAGLLAAFLLVPACALVNNDNGGQATDTDRAALRANNEVWRNRSVDDYTLTYQINCFCAEEWRGPFEVEVRDGAIVSIQYNGEAVDPERQQFYTVSGLFGLLEDAFDRNAEKVTVTYDEELGHPVEFYIDYNFGIADEEIGATVLDLVLHR
jgi:hypothetical protein